MAKKVLCNRCTAMCCRYVALPLDTPEDRDDFDDIRWYLSHEGVSIFVEKGDWYVNFSANCRHIGEDHRCNVYEQRPKICRKYKMQNCDKTSDEYDYEFHFTDDKQMQEYMKVKFDNMKISTQKKVLRTQNTEIRRRKDEDKKTTVKKK